MWQAVKCREFAAVGSGRQSPGILPRKKHLDPCDFLDISNRIVEISIRPGGEGKPDPTIP
jgi:hypothetical protein